MGSALIARTAKVLVIEPAASVRQLFTDALKALGFKDITTAPNCKDALTVIEVEKVNWILTSTMADDPVNALHLLKLFTEEAPLRQIRTSLFTDGSDSHCVTLAFELGLLSSHPKAFVRDQVTAELKELLEIIEAHSGNSTLTSAHYLHRFLIENKQYRLLVSFHEALLNHLPGSPEVLLKLAEAQFLNQEAAKGLGTLLQVEYLDPAYVEKVQALSKRYLRSSADADTKGQRVPPQNALGVNRCVIVDPDTIIQKTLTDYLQYAGVPQIFCFEIGEKALEWCKENGEPDLIIQEWRIPGLSGPQFLQRVRQLGQNSVPIIVISSLIKKDEVPLVREMSVSAVVSKPLEKFSFFNDLIWTLQQNKCPTEQRTFEQKIRQLLKAEKLTEAESLKNEFVQITAFSEGGKKAILAEMAFAQKKYRQARDFAMEALKISGDSLPLLSLLGKSLMKIGDFSAALRCMEKAQSISPHNLERLCQIAEAQYEMGKADAAKESLKTANQLDKGNPLVARTDAQLSLLSGDSGRAKKLLSQLDGLPNVVSYMNNRAVALTRCGQFEAGIKLYNDTMQALPEDKNDVHDIVAYNLGLAFVRHGDLEKAQEHLKAVKSQNESPLGKKAKSLLARIARALQGKESLTLVTPDVRAEDKDEESSDNGANKKTNSADGKKDMALNDTPLYGGYDAHPGELCCYLIFNNRTDRDVFADKLLENLPRFGSRKAIQKEN